MSVTAVETVVAKPVNDLALVLESSGLDQSSATNLIESFSPFWIKARSLISESSALVVTDPTQVTEIKASRQFRLRLRDVRIDADKMRKDMKEESLRMGKGIQNVFNAVLALIEPEEQRLDDQEKIAERMEAERKTKIKAERDAMLVSLGVNPAVYQTSLMTPAEFDQLISGIKADQAARLAEQARIAEENRVREVERAAEESRIREENARLRAEAEEAERLAKIERGRVAAEQWAAAEKARKEREALEAKARTEREALEANAAEERRVAEEALCVEREAREAAEAQARQQREEAEAKARAEREAEELRAAAEEESRRKAEAAPDRTKLLELAAEYVATAATIPQMKSKKGHRATAEITRRVLELANFIEQLANGL